MRELILSGGELCLVSDEDYDYLARWVWRTDRGRAVRRVQDTCLKMHHVVAVRMGLVCDEVDHRDRNDLNNQRENLRAATRSQNKANRNLQKNNTSGYKGVSVKGSRFEARIKRRGSTICLGTHDTAEEAALAYNRAAVRLFGEFAALNEVTPCER